MNNLNFSIFLNDIIAHPALLITFILTVGVIFVNGWTDAPNAIATCVATRSISAKKAVLMSAVFNFLGVLVMTLLNSGVVMTIKNMVNFEGDQKMSAIALCAAMTAIIAWAVIAWMFGIPTSESHALIAGLSGAAIALQNSFSGINAREWLTVIYGLFLSTFLGFGSGYLFAKITENICKNMDRRKTTKFFEKAQILAGASMSFMHGAQDGQKFIGVMILGVYLSYGYDSASNVNPPLWMMIICSVVMALGTSIGGYKIIKAVGMDMVKLEKYQGFSADIAGAFCLFVSTVFGIPVSTTHTKTTAIIGVGACKRVSSVNMGVVKEMALTWILTFPGCSIIGFCTAKLFIELFM